MFGLIRQQQRTHQVRCVLEFYKTVLQKVSFDKTLFRKEYVKALSDLSASDKLKLMWWCNKEFPPMVLSPEKEF